MTKILEKKKKKSLTILFILLSVLILFIPTFPIFFYTSWTYTVDTSFSTRDGKISSDGNYCAIGPSNHVYLFKRTNSEPLWSFRAHGFVISLAISSEGQYIVAGTDEGMVYLFKNTDSTPLWTYDLSGETITFVDISADGKYIVTGGSDGGIYVFNNLNSNPLWSNNLGEKIRELAISDNGNYIVVCTERYQNNRIFLFDRLNSIPLWNQTIENYIIKLAISKDGTYIVSGSSDNKVCFFNNTSPIPLWSYSTTGPISDITISSDGNYIVAGTQSDIIYLFNKISPTPIWVHAISGNLNSVKMSANGDYIALAFTEYRFNTVYQNKITLFKTLDPNPILTIIKKYSMYDLDLSYDGKYFITRSHNKILFFDLENPLQFEDYFNTLVTSMLTILITELLIGLSYTLYNRSKKRMILKKEESIQLKKFKEFIGESDQIKIDTLQNIFEIEKKILDKKILDWALKFNLTIEGDHLIINKDTVSDFIDALDKQFKKWEKNKKKKL